MTGSVPATNSSRTGDWQSDPGSNPVGAQTGFIRTSHGVDKLTGETLAKFVDGIPMARLAVPEDVASAVEYLASPEANFLTGVCIDVDGGRSIQ